MQTELEYIWKDLNGELQKFVFGKTKDKEVSREIVQEVFLKVQINIKQLRDTSKLTSWVYQITRNTISDYYRSKHNDLSSLDGINIPEDDGECFEYSKLSNCINQKIANLSQKYKEAIVLTMFRNYSQKDLAKHLQIPYSTVKSRVQNAKGILKKEILDCPNVEKDSLGRPLDFVD